MNCRLLTLVLRSGSVTVVSSCSGCSTGWGCSPCTLSLLYFSLIFLHDCPFSGLALEALITLLTPAFIPFFMILWIISTSHHLMKSQCIPNQISLSERRGVHSANRGPPVDIQIRLRNALLQHLARRALHRLRHQEHAYVCTPPQHIFSS